ncbi:MAG TPA: isoaspartyl peptidase/L-asparaginase [Terracidiphilus sp.]|nr:isoaspartyl peptidase/L-asparaginase [Terracidiphilus sp.]
MNKLRCAAFLMLFSLAFLRTTWAAAPAPAASANGWAIAIHGGAGEDEWEHMTPATAAAYHQALARALAAGVAVLKRNGKALDAVQTAVEVLEDDPLFNAGRGAAFADDGSNEMDAALMDGSTLAAGGVAAVHFTRHPIALARAVMDHTPYVLMVGTGADAFARQQRIQQEPPAYFFTEMRWKEFLMIMHASHKPIPPLPRGVASANNSSGATAFSAHIFLHRFGTVGAVARDSAGHLAAATSTGGMQGKLPGRVGDSPLIGDGTYASDRTCAVSGTGVGEYFIRLNLAHEVCTLVGEGRTPQQAADHMIHSELPALKGGEGGVIVIAPTGAPVWSSNTLGMFRARQQAGQAPEIHVR